MRLVSVAASLGSILKMENELKHSGMWAAFAATLAVVFCALGLFACSDPPDNTPLGKDASAVLARPEQPVDKVKVQHVLIAFVGATRGSESHHTFEEARTLTEEVLKRARDGEDFAALMKQYSSDDGGGTYTLTQEDRGAYAHDFSAVAFRLAVGEIGVTNYNPGGSPFGWHVMKRLE
jgi:hypothetical protein